jgi:hypothetical protein
MAGISDSLLPVPAPAPHCRKRGHVWGRPVIPAALRQEVMKTLHAGHACITTMMTKAAQSLFLLNMKQDMLDVREHCRSCIYNVPLNPAPKPCVQLYPTSCYPTSAWISSTGSHVPGRCGLLLQLAKDGYRPQHFSDRQTRNSAHYDISGPSYRPLTFIPRKVIKCRIHL